MDTPTASSVFPDQYPDRRPAEAMARERAEVEKQARHLAHLSDDTAHRREVIDTLQGRRAGRTDLVQFEAIDEGGIPILVAAGELLVHRDDLDKAETRRLIDDLKLASRPVDAVSGSVIRLVEGETDPRRTRLRGRMGQVIEEIGRSTARVSPNYIPTLGVVMKGEGGPEPSAGGRDFPSVSTPAAGPPVAVTVIDTGITGKQRTDGWLQGLLTSDNEDRLDVIPAPDGALDLGAGHGTFAAGIVQQVAPGADLRMLLAMDTDGLGSEADVAAMIIKAVQDGAKIFSLSLGTQTLGDVGPLTLRAALETAFALNPELLVVAAAGNYSDTRPCWPAAFSQEFPNVVAVAGLLPDGGPAPWSSHGSWVTCSTIGQGVVSTYVEGTEDKRVEDPPDTFLENPWASWTGTSFAAPQVAGAVARRCQEQPALTPTAALDELRTQATAIPGYGDAMVILPGT